MNLEDILTDLKQKKDRISRAIAALEGPNISRTAAKNGARSAVISDKRGKGLTPEGRKRLSLAMKKRWAERRKKAS